MIAFDLASFDVRTFDPVQPARRPQAAPFAAIRAASREDEPAPVVAIADPAEVARLGEVIELLKRQLNEAKAANSALSRRLDDHIEEPRREADQAARLKHLFASRFKSPVG